MLLRYTGQQPVTFTSLGIEVEPGGTFEVPDSDAPGYLTRGDVEAADVAPADRPARGKRATKADESVPAGDGTTPAGPTPDTTEAP